jgi:hypothetical protein
VCPIKECIKVSSRHYSFKENNWIGNFVSKEGLGFSNGFQTKFGIQHLTHIPIWGFYGDDCYLKVLDIFGLDVLSTMNFEKKLEKLPSRAFLYYNQIQTPI